MSASSTEQRGRFAGISPQSERGLIAFLAALSGLSALGIDVLLPALGDIRAAYDLAPDSTRVSLVVTTYLFGLGIGQVVYGPIADRFGRKPAVLAGLSLYAAGAIGAGLSPSLEAMLAFRFVMGLGAASPRAMSLTIARDRFSGDAMTRVMSLVMLFFQLSPAVAPLLGAGLLVVGSWQLIFGFAAVMALLTMLWTTRFRETLAPERRLPLTFARTLRSAKAIGGSRWALGHGLVLMFEFTAFYVYLSSSELVFDDVFDRGELFAVSFAIGALVQAAANLIALAPRAGHRDGPAHRRRHDGVRRCRSCHARRHRGGRWSPELLALARPVVDAERAARARADVGEQPGDATVGRVRRYRLGPDRHDVDDGCGDHLVVRRGDDPRIGHTDVARLLRVRAAGRGQPVVGERWQPRTGRMSARLAHRHC